MAFVNEALAQRRGAHRAGPVLGTLQLRRGGRATSRQKQLWEKRSLISRGTSVAPDFPQLTEP